MASRKNDLLLSRTVEGPFNYYDNHKGCGTATDKGLAARLGGHSYNIINNQDKDEIYFPNMRHDGHFLDKKGRHTIHLFGPRKRKFAPDERNLVGKSLRAPEPHPREEGMQQRRLEYSLAQIENSTSYPDFRQRCKESLFPNSPRKRYSIHNKLYANEGEKLRPKITSSKGDWLQRRGEVMTRSISAPNVCLTDPQSSLSQAVHEDARKEASQRQTESAHFAPWNCANTYSATMDSTHHGRRHHSEHKKCSVNRLENHDFAITRKNNHFSSQDKLTRSDPFFMRPRHSIENNSVKYDIVSNERKWFKY
jgi:hypothetical protein